MLHREVGLATVCVVVSLLPVFVRVAQRKFDPFEPIQIVGITFFVLYGLRPLSELIWHINYFVNQYTRGGFDGACLISAVGMLSLYIGYALRGGLRVAERAPGVPDRFDAERSVRFGIWILVWCALLCAAYAATVGPSVWFHFYFGRTHNDYQTGLQVVGYVGLGPYLTIPAAVIFAFAFARLRTFKTFLLLAISAGGAIFFTFPRGDRTYILALVLPLLVFPYLRNKRRPAPILTVVALIVAVIALNVFAAIRQTTARAPLLTTIEHGFTHVGGQLKHFAIGTDLAEFSVLELEQEAYATKDNPLTFHPGQTILCFLVYPLPRRLVKKKPPAAGQWVVDRLFPTHSAKRASFNPAIFGDFYADGGYVTIILYDLFVGIVVRFIWEYFRRFESSEGVQILYAATLPVLVIMVRNSVVDAFARSLFLSGPLLLCLIVCSRQKVRRLAGYRLHPRVKTPLTGFGTELK
jgi:hypothetical protein